MKSTNYVRARHDETINQIINNNPTQKHNLDKSKSNQKVNSKVRKVPHIGFKLQ